jgi:hypothetical protein
MITINNEVKEEVKPKIVFTNEVNLGQIGTLKITQNLQKLIDYLHFKIGSTEWSGILFYKLTGGNIKDLKNLEFTADFVYPMNIGSSAYTEFDYNEDVINAYDTYPEGMEMSTALIHSHHSMQAFFSGTDSTELKDNASHYNYYLSLIVNFSHVYCAKVAFPSKTEVVSKFSIRDSFGKFFNRSSKKEENSILIGDLRVVIENNVETPEWIEERIKVLEEKKKNSVVTTYSNFTVNESINKEYPQYGRNSRIYNDFDTPTRNLYEKYSKKKDYTNSNKGVDYRNKSSQFLSALINLNPDKTKEDLSDVLTQLNKLSEDEMGVYEVSLDTNIEIIHASIYESEKDIKKHCLEAKLELYSLEPIFGETEVFNLIYETLTAYE